MILTRTPLRICLGGGGTDLPAYALQYGGYVISAAIDKYVYIVLNRYFGSNYLVKYSKSEDVTRLEDIQHPVVRAVYNLLKVPGGVEMTSFMDLPARTGLGSSSSFTVGLLYGAHTLANQIISTRDLAQKAVYVERELLAEAGGIQDQYIAAYGGIQIIHIDRTGDVHTSPLQVSLDILHDLEGRLMMFYTGIQRESAAVQSSVNKKIKDETETVKYLHRVKEIGIASAEALTGGDLDAFGRLLDEHWQEKRRMSGDISSGPIDELYALGREHGALGGKLIGAGGGGFLLFYARNGDRAALRAALTARGLRELRFRFEHRGSTIVANLT